MADALVPPPSEEEYNRGPRVQTNSDGIGSYIPPEIKQLGRSALDLVNMMDPVQGIMAGMRDSGRAFNPDLSPEERKRAAVSAALETTFAAAPVAAAKLMKAPAKAALVDALTLTGAPTSMADDISDPSRRAFMKGAAATAGVAALAPEAITEALEKVPAAVKRVKPPINPIDMFAKNIKVLRDEMNAAYDAADELAEDLPPADPIGAPTRPFDEAIAEAEKLHMDLDATTEMDMRELISEIGPKEIAGAADESLEELSQALTDFRMYSEEEYIEQMIPLAEEIQKRGLLEVKDKYGLTQYPYARTVFEDVQDYLRGDKFRSKPFFDEPPDAGMKMTDRDSLSLADLFKKDQADRKLAINEEKINTVISDGKNNNLSADEINKKVLEVATRERIPHPKRAFDDPNVEYVDTELISQKIPRGNPIKYNISTFQREGGQFYDPMSTDYEDFSRSGQETLRESIHNEGIKEPIVIGVSKETGEVLLNEGHHRLHAALQMEIPKIPVIVKVFGSKLPKSEFQSPAIINTKGLKKFKNMSFSELDFDKRVIRPKASSDQAEDEFFNRTSNYYYGVPPYRTDKPLTDEKNFPPMRPGFFRITDEKADGGEMRKGVGSLSEIARRMNEGGEVFIPTQEDLNAMAERVKKLYGFDPVETALEEGVDPDLALRIMMRESSGDHSKGSEKGAFGLMQLMPITAKDVGVDRTDPLQNYVGGLRYLKKMQKRFGPVEGLAAYNAGPTAVEEYGGIPPFKETQDYVRSILTPHTGVDYEDQIQTDAETALMQMPVQAASDVLRPRSRPAGLAPVFQNELNESLRPMARPEQQQQVEEAVEAAVRPSLQEKYSPEGIEQLLIGTTAEPLLPRQFQQGSPSGVGR